MYSWLFKIKLYCALWIINQTYWIISYKNVKLITLSTHRAFFLLKNVPVMQYYSLRL